MNNVHDEGIPYSFEIPENQSFVFKKDTKDTENEQIKHIPKDKITQLIAAINDRTRRALILSKEIDHLELLEGNTHKLKHRLVTINAKSDVLLKKLNRKNVTLTNVQYKRIQANIKKDIKELESIAKDLARIKSAQSTKKTPHKAELEHQDKSFSLNIKQAFDKIGTIPSRFSRHVHKVTMVDESIPPPNPALKDYASNYPSSEIISLIEEKKARKLNTKEKKLGRALERHISKTLTLFMPYSVSKKDISNASENFLELILARYEEVEKQIPAFMQSLELMAPYAKWQISPKDVKKDYNIFSDKDNKIEIEISRAQDGTWNAFLRSNGLVLNRYICSEKGNKGIQQAIEWAP